MLIKVLLINTVFAMITAYLIYYFLKSNFKITMVRNRLLFFIVFFGVVNGVTSILWMEYIPSNLQFIKSILVLILSVVIIKYLLRVDIIKSALCFFIITLFMGIGNFTAPLVFYAFGINATPEIINSNVFLFIIMNIIIYTIALFFTILTTLTKKISHMSNLKPVGFLLFITFLIMAINAGIHYISSFDPVSFIATLISSLVYLIASIWYINKYHNYEMEIEEKNQQAFYNESLSNTLQDLRRFKHDQANHLSVINTMLKMNKYEAATEYLKEIVEATESSTNISIFSIKNAGLFGIISNKMNRANSLGVKFDLKVIGAIESIPNIKISELCEVIGIHLDNAIEASQQSIDKIVEMTIMSTNTNIEITIMNSCATTPILNESSNVAETAVNERGNGLRIVREILNNNKAVLNIIKFNEESLQFIQMLKIKKGL